MSLFQVVSQTIGFRVASNMPSTVLDLAYTHQRVMVRHVRSSTQKRHNSLLPLVDSLASWFSLLLLPRSPPLPILDRAAP